MRMLILHHKHIRKMRTSLLDIRIHAIGAVIIRYSQIGNEPIPILNTFKNNFNQFLVFWACFENIMQYRK
jgi:hypothetical protein